MLIITIDPGVHGGVAIFDNGSLLNTFNLDSNELKTILKNIKKDKKEVQVFIEKAQTMPQNGVVSSFNYGRSYGVLLGLFLAMNIKYTEVNPRVWKNYFGLNSDKQKSIDMVLSLYKHSDVIYSMLKKTKRSKKLHDGKAEAILIGHYCYNIIKDF